MIIKILLGIFFTISTFFAQGVYAQEDAILFWGTTCPFCHEVMEDIKERELDKEIDILNLEIYEDKDNLEIFKEKIGVCGIDINRAGVPMLFVENECFVGPDQIISKLLQMTNGELGDIDENNEAVETVEIVEEEDMGKRNTLYFILGIVVVLLALVGLGFLSQKSKAKETLTILLLVGLGYFVTTPTHAICPVCTVAVGAGLGLSRYFGIDDVITGIWIGGLIISMTLWFVGWLDSKKIEGWKKTALKIVAGISFLALVIYTLVLLDIVGNPLNRLWGVDKILLGMFFGAVSFLSAAKLHFYIKDKRDGKVLFPFQKVIFTVGILLVTTIIFYMIVY